MISDWFFELMKGFGRLFMQPVTYWTVLLLMMASVKRIKRERRDFGSKIFHIFAEWRKTIGISLLFGLILSIVSIAVGFSLPYPVVLLYSAVVILLTLSLRFSWISPAYTLALTAVLLLWLPELNTSFLPDSWVTAFENTSFTALGLLMGVFLILEAILFHRFRNNDSFPQYVKGSRGKLIGQHRLKRLGFLPVFFLIPGGAIEPFAGWWPIFEIGDGTYGLMAAPILLGFEHVVRGVSPRSAALTMRSSLVVLAILVLGLSVASFYVPILALVAIVLAPVGREISSFLLRWRDHGKNPYFTPRYDGLPILGVIPGSPADQMNLVVGETIEKVNGLNVTNEQDFYYAVQSNLAYCKIAVKDTAGEIRFAKRAMYENDHYELGLVFVKDQYAKQKKAK
ncbi:MULTISPECIES: PDZ domain-containing protein [Pontibacillus]|uniref:PDZ domain-containing protein n=1 Tax=Pontibacillus chungwhensis TaxID=265426 RepID=A0ABY8UYX3_9BACI|nr:MULTISPECIES: PDZ domain-containing protein [Pontibacillus]MCD5325889.1 PDZ domain-containing protein [Pontibacillus sp. HN14]WIF97600.1 PDZ domain-containing protein [Pontibacillus chungwhensis]